MQKFHREQAQAIATSFNQLAGRLKRAICGLPIFKGHPDVPGLANDYPDKEEKGQVAAVEVRPTGLAFKLVLSSAGSALVSKGWKFISPYWLANVIAVDGAGKKTFSPYALRSIGLVSRPNIPSPSLANAASAANPKTTMDPEMLKLLGLAVDATPAQIAVALKALHTQASSLANEQSALATAKAELLTAQGKLTALETALTTARAEAATAQTGLANERKARVEDTLALAIRTGRCTPAEKATWEGRLLANFAAESTALANAAPKVKTASEIPAMLKELEKQMQADLANAAKKGGKTAGDDGDEDDGKDECGMGNAEYGKLDSAGRGKKMKDLINEHSRRLANTPHPDAYNRAYANAKKANPRLFGFKQTDVAKE